MDDSVADEELMLRYRDGDARAFEALYARHKGGLYRYFLRLARPAAEELFQDVWASVIRVREGYEVRAKFSTWLYRLAHNRLVDHYRRSGVNASAFDAAADTKQLERVADHAWREPESEFERRRLGQRLTELLAALPPAQCEIFLLREEGGLTLEEIAAVTGIDLEAAKSRLRYALAKLRDGLSPMISARDKRN